MHRLSLGLLIALLLAIPAAAQALVTDWNARKCAAYVAAWNQAVEAFGTSDVAPDFVSGNETFIASGCAEPANICPLSARELDIANAMTLALMNAGTASTFLPFRCPHPRATEGGWTGPGL